MHTTFTTVLVWLGISHMFGSGFSDFHIIWTCEYRTIHHLSNELGTKKLLFTQLSQQCYNHWACSTCLEVVFVILHHLDMWVPNCIWAPNSAQKSCYAQLSHQCWNHWAFSTCWKVVFIIPHHLSIELNHLWTELDTSTFTCSQIFKLFIFCWTFSEGNTMVFH